MISFQQIAQKMLENSDPKIDAVFKVKSEDFWRDLANIAGGGNKDGLALLLQVPEAQVRQWPRLIADAIKSNELNKNKKE